MFPQAVPRLVFAFGMMWAWLVFPLPIYGTFWVLLIAYLTVFMPLGVRAISGVILQLDKSLDECGQVCGASWVYRLRTITAPLLRPGLLAAWLLIFVASVRELGASILLMGPDSKVMTPAIVEAWFSTSSELTAAMALIQTAVIAVVMLALRVAHAPGGASRGGRAMTSTSAPAIAVENLSIRYGTVTAVEDDQLHGRCRPAADPARPFGLRQDVDAARRRWAGEADRRARSASAAGPMFDGSNGINVPAEQRGMSMVFQSYAIWPHMTVFDNVAYGLRVRNESGAALKEKVRHALELVKMGPYAERNASALSGGQQQRVALARAIAFSPSVILFDEPLSNLDAKLRSEMRIELRELQRRLGVTSLYVTHDLEEALAMSDRIVVMRAGLVEQSGTPAEIYDYPRTEFVADFVGSANLVSGEVVRATIARAPSSSAPPAATSSTA